MYPEANNAQQYKYIQWFSNRMWALFDQYNSKEINRFEYSNYVSVRIASSLKY